MPDRRSRQQFRPPSPSELDALYSRLVLGHSVNGGQLQFNWRLPEEPAAGRGGNHESRVSRPGDRQRGISRVSRRGPAAKDAAMKPPQALMTAIGLLAIVGLSGCASAGVAIDRYSGTPPGVDMSSDSDPVPVAILDDDGNLALVTYRGSSCSPTATSIERTRAGAVNIELERDAGGPCTADIAPTTHLIPLSDGATSRPLTVHVAYIGEPWDITRRKNTRCRGLRSVPTDFGRSRGALSAEVFPHLLGGYGITRRIIERDRRAISSENVQFQRGHAGIQHSTLDCCEQGAPQTAAAPRLDDLDVVQEGRVRGSARVIQADPRSTHGVPARVNSAEKEHPRRADSQGQKLGVGLECTLDRPFLLPTPDSNLFGRELLGNRFLPLVELNLRHRTDAYLAHAA